MRNRQMQIGRLRGAGQELAVKLNGALVSAESHPGHRMERAVVAIVGVRGQKLRGLLLRPLVEVALDEDLRVVETGRVIVRRHIEHALQ